MTWQDRCKQKRRGGAGLTRHRLNKMDENLIFDMDNLGMEEDTVKSADDQESGSQSEKQQEGFETEAGQGSGSVFDIQAETYDDRVKTATSLTDRFGISVFSDAFENKTKLLQQENTEEFDRIFLNVMTNKEQASVEKYFETVMQADVGTVLKTEYDGKQETSLLTLFSYGFFGMFLAGTVLFFIEKRRRSKANENYSYDPQQYHT